MVPLQAAAAVAGVYIPLDSNSGSAIFKTGGTSFKLVKGSTNALIGGKTVCLPAAPVLINNIFYVPLDFVLEAFNGQLIWDEDKNSLIRSFIAAESKPNETLTTTPNNYNVMSIDPGRIDIYGNLVLINKWNPISDSYVPDDLSSIMDRNKKYIVPAKTSGVSLKREALNAAAVMFNTAAKAGAKDLIISNGYRSYNLQNTYYKRKINFYKKTYRGKQAEEKAAMIVAPPGTSEHQSGLAMDITTRKLLNTNNHLSENFAKTPEGKWVYNNSWKYGFNIRYQADKTKITGIISEPWHLRYVGLPHSEIMYKNKMCLEEYLEYIKNKGYIKYKCYSGEKYEIFYLIAPPPVGKLTLNYTGSNKYTVSKYGQYGFIITKKV